MGKLGFRLPLIVQTLSILLLYSCAIIKETKKSQVIDEFEKCFCNDSLKTQIKVLTFSKFTVKPTYSELRVVKRLASKGRYQYLFKASVKANPPFEFYALRRETKFSEQRLRSYQRVDLNDSLSYWMRVRSYKKKRGVDVLVNYSNQAIGLYIFPVDSLIDQLRHHCDCNDSFDAAVKKFLAYNIDYIVRNIRCGKSYTTCKATDPLALAEEKFNTTDSGNYLMPILALQRSKENYRTDMWNYRQILATYYSFAGMIDSANNAMKPGIADNKLGEGKLKMNISELANLIADSAQHHQILMINEAHTQPKTRYFGGLLLKKLYDAGYRFLAVEALRSDSINARKFVSVKDGFYTREPTFANLLNQAVQIGYKLVSYDTSAWPNRETNACDLLNEKVFKFNPQAKLVVWVGHAHVDESDRGKQSWLAYYFKRDLKKDPFTVDQTGNDALSSSDDRSFEVSLGKKEKGKHMYNCDLYVSHTLNSLKESNCFCEENSKNVTIKLDELRLTENKYEEYILYVYSDNHLVTKQVPTAIRYIGSKFRQVNINLCEGSYKLLIKNQFHETIYSGDIKVSMEK